MSNAGITALKVGSEESRALRCWRYNRPEGELEIWAASKEEAYRALVQYGFQVLFDKIREIPWKPF